MQRTFAVTAFDFERHAEIEQQRDHLGAIPLRRLEQRRRRLEILGVLLEQSPNASRSRRRQALRNRSSSVSSGADVAAPWRASRLRHRVEALADGLVVERRSSLELGMRRDVA